jgi:hypothetical protein
MSSETKTSRSSSSNRDRSVSVTQIFDATSENFTKLVNESARVQPQYAQAVSNLQQEYIEAVKNAIQTTTSIQKQLANSNSNFSNVVVSDSAAPFVQGLVAQSTEFTNNLIRLTDINNQLTINALNALRENVKNYSRTVEAAANYNANLAEAWVSSTSSIQQQFTPSRQ